jgi:hypothetical protein
VTHPTDDSHELENWGFRNANKWGTESGTRRARRNMHAQLRKIYCVKYSDCIANGDETDNRAIENEDDPRVPLVDYNGHTNRGYGAMRMSDFDKINHPLPPPPARYKHAFSRQYYPY